MDNSHKAENKKYLKSLENRADIDGYFEDQAKFAVAKLKFDRIDNFNDEFGFLNNDFESPVALDRQIYPTVSAAFQAARTDLSVFREKFQRPLDVHEFFDTAKQIPDPPGWTTQRLRVMEQLIRDKFIRSPDLRAKLADTGDRELVNAFRDRHPANLFWGSVAGEGLNHLGKLLMKTRKSIQLDTDVADWASITLHFPTDRFHCPDFTVQVVKEGQTIERHQLRDKGWFLVGNSTNVDFPMAHESISRRHCIVGFDNFLGILVVDLNSTHGTRVDGTLLTPLIAHSIPNIKFQMVCGQSTRTNHFQADFGHSIRHLEREKLKLEGGGDREGARDQTRVHISGLGPTPLKRDIDRLFDRFARVVFVEVFENSRRKEGGWHGFVKFQDQNGISRVMSEPGIFLGDQKVAVAVARR